MLLTHYLEQSPTSISKNEVTGIGEVHVDGLDTG